jgi:hypothetical protein
VQHTGIKANMEIAGLHQSEKAGDGLALGEGLEAFLFDQRGQIIQTGDLPFRTRAGGDHPKLGRAMPNFF